VCAAAKALIEKQREAFQKEKEAERERGMEAGREAAAAENREHHAWLARLLRRKRSLAGAGVVYSVIGDEFDYSLDSSIHSLSKLNVSSNLVTACTLDALSENATEKKGAAATAQMQT